MKVRALTGRRREFVTAPRVGLFGLLGSGNIGNDVSMEAVLRYLRAEHPDAIIDAMCVSPDRLSDYDVETVPLFWYHKYEHRVSGTPAIALKVLGKGIDAFRTAAWVRRHDVVIVPGMGVLETTLPLRPWLTPYEMFLLCTSGRLFGTKVALVSVGASLINQRLTRWLFDSAARLAYYRSYRDSASRDAMRQRGLDTSRDYVYPDLAFGIPTPPCGAGDPGTVGVGVMAYYGSNDDRHRADEIHASYIENLKLFTRWLVDSGRRVRLLTSDASDESVVQEILADVRAYRPDLHPTWVAAEPVCSFAELTQAIAPLGTVVATRFHNIICALKLAKPTIAIGYAAKTTAIMADAGLSEFCQSADSLDVGMLTEQFSELNRRSAELKRTIAERNALNARLLEDQFRKLSAVLFPDEPSSRDRGHEKPVAVTGQFSISPDSPAYNPAPRARVQVTDSPVTGSPGA
jgi:polysaccharide pyruvyl transferase WcaK-like protein